ncbi:hypothetical protein AB8807_19330 [Xanthomonas campestris pv. olitorii]|nr:hypothetical protein [Xanthomonas citri]WPM77144.1 hypothetical protein XVT_02585 [Xanthomonas citri pv. viticola]WVK06336.1 hypothetical protein KWH09_19295 [Xanthomonas campestris pv. olitorii]
MNRFTAWMLVVSLVLPPVVAAPINTLPSQPHLMVKGSRFQVDRIMKIVQLPTASLNPSVIARFIGFGSSLLRQRIR